MTITSNDIKLYQAQDNTDNDSGGGSRTSTEIVDGDVNNLFPDISRIDTVSGDVALRKVFPTVTTSNSDVYYGAHSIIRKSPTDEKVSALLFSTDDPHDKRSEAQNKIESYVTASYLAQFWLYGANIQGARTVQFLSRLETALPDAGEVYALTDGGIEQYVRIVEVDAMEVSLVFSQTEYVRKLLICKIDQPLKHNFNGSSFLPSGQADGSANTFATQVSDASKFYGTKTLSADATIGNTSLMVDSIYEQLVPATKSQTPLINQAALSKGDVLVPSGSVVDIKMIGVSTITPGKIIYFPTAITPLSITKFGTTASDDGLGNLSMSGNKVANIDYKAGTVTWVASTVGFGAFTATYQPADVVSANIQFTGDILISSANQGYVYVRNLSPMPSPMDLYVDYRSQGKWYRITSNGDGTLGNDPSIGAGLIFNNGDGTGSISLTLGSLPDLDSSVIVSWGSNERLNNRKVFTASETQAYLEIDLGQTNIDLTTFSWVLYYNSSLFRTITCDASGILTDAGTTQGYVDPIVGKITITSTTDGVFESVGSANNSIIDFDYVNVDEGEVGEIKTVVISRTPTGIELPIGVENQSGGALSFSIGESPLLSSVRLELKVDYEEDSGSATPTTKRIVKPYVLIANSTGQLRPAGSTDVWGTVNSSGDVAITFPSVTVKRHVSTAITPFGGSIATYNDVSVHFRLATDVNDNADNITVTYKTADPAAYALSHNITDKIENIAKYKITTVANIIGEVGLMFLAYSADGIYNLFSKDGVMYNNFTQTGIGTNIGVIDYVSGEITLDYFKDPSVLFIEFNKLFSDDIGEDIDKAANLSFKTASTKLTAGSFQLRYETANGSYSATTDSSGFITGADINSVESRVDALTGMASVVFTSPVVPGSVVYDAVAEVSLPLDPELLGLDPVRLPSDGRVPVFASGRHLVIFHETTTATTNPTPQANDVETLTRSGQAHIEVIDVNGKRLDPVQYTADRTTGTVTFSPTLVLENKYGEALTAPFSIVDRIENMLLATDVQINGLLSLSGQLSYAFPKDETKVASALVWGDTGARVYNLFAQEIWDSGNPVWSNNLIGDNTTAQYDVINNPIQIDNKSSTAGRWAIIFKSSTTVDVVHEKLGIVQAGVSISINDIAPLNPATGNPYFTMYKEGFGGGWATNNVIRFNTDSGDNNMWVIRTVQSGALSELTDSIDIEVRGDAN